MFTDNSRHENTIKLLYVIKYVCQKFGVCNICRQIPYAGRCHNFYLEIFLTIFPKLMLI